MISHNDIVADLARCNENLIDVLDRIFTLEKLSSVLGELDFLAEVVAGKEDDEMVEFTKGSILRLRMQIEVQRLSLEIDRRFLNKGIRNMRRDLGLLLSSQTDLFGAEKGKRRIGLL